MSFYFQNPDLEHAKADPTLFFRDGRRRINMVLAFQDEEIKEHQEDGLGGTTPISHPKTSGGGDVNGGDDGLHGEERKREARATFEENLRVAGLELEYEHAEVIEWPTLRRR